MIVVASVGTFGEIHDEVIVKPEESTRWHKCRQVIMEKDDLFRENAFVG
jgi:hypothetical protein